VTPFFVHPGDLLFSPVANLSFVMPGLVPGIHVFVSTPRSVDGRDFNCKDALRALARP
jgi:hypothetical protein